mgnify:FL=1
MADEPIKLPEVLLAGEQPRDKETGKFLPKRPLEMTWPHFWLEVSEIAVGILIAQIVWELGVWTKEMIWLIK